jgi:hypothetical protein
MWSLLMETQNITLSLPKRTLRKIRMIAVQRQVSVSGLLTELLEQLADQETGYNRARHRQSVLMEKGFDLGFGGTLPPRETLHER